MMNGYDYEVWLSEQLTKAIEYHKQWEKSNPEAQEQIRQLKEALEELDNDILDSDWEYVD